MIRFECPHCGNSMKVPRKAAGRQGTCNKCGEKVTVPHSTSIVNVTPEIVRPAEPPAAYQPPPQPQQYAAPRPTVAVQVNHKPQSSNSMGIASVILGFIAFMICWIPFINVLSVFLGGIAAILAVIGIALGVSRGGTGVGYSIAGAALASIALFFSAGFFLALFGGAAVVGHAVDSANRDMANQHVFENAEMANTPNQDGQQSKPVDKWSGKGLSSTVGDITVEILGTDVDRAQFKGIGDREASTTEKEYLLVKLKITNNSDVKKHSYTPWESGRYGKDPLLTDEHGNTYVARSPTFQEYTGSVDFKELYPDESVEDLYVFERPVGKASNFKMNLYPRSFTDGKPVLLKFACSKELINEAQAKGKSEKNDSEKPVMTIVKSNPNPQPVSEFNRRSTAGGVAVEITKAAFGNHQGKECLEIHLNIKNNSSVSKTYNTWQSKYYSSGDLLTDNLGNSYETFPVKSEPKKIESSGLIDDVLYFEKPDPKATEFELFLYPRTFTERKPLYFKFKMKPK